MRYSIERCPCFKDERGNLLQFITDNLLKKFGLEFGQIYIVTFEGQNIIRGNHYHNHSSEIFCLVSGIAEITLFDLQTNEKFQQVFDAGKNEFFRITLSKKIAHSIKSISDFVVVVGFSSAEYNPEDEDKMHYKII